MGKTVYLRLHLEGSNPLMNHLSTNMKLNIEPMYFRNLTQRRCNWLNLNSQSGRMFKWDLGWCVFHADTLGNTFIIPYFTSLLPSMISEKNSSTVI